MKFTNKSYGAKAVRAVGGYAVLKADESRDIEGDFDDAYLARLEAAGLQFETPEAVEAEDEAEDEAVEAVEAVEDEDEAVEVSRDDLKAMAAELGLEYPANITTANLKNLVDASTATPATEGQA